MTISNLEDKSLELQEILSRLSNQYTDSKNKDTLRTTNQTSSKGQLLDKIAQEVSGKSESRYHGALIKYVYTETARENTVP